MNPNVVSLMKYYIQNGEISRSKAEAEKLLQQNPEDVTGYMAMVFHYSLLKQVKELRYWVGEMLKRGPEEENTLAMALSTLEGIQEASEERAAITTTALRLYPENAYFHYQEGMLTGFNDIEKGIHSFKEAIRIEPENDIYLGHFAVFLYQIGNEREAETYEKRSLYYEPENDMMLLNFAMMAYHYRKYKKAQYLISEALRVNPEHPLIREQYQKIYPTKHVLIRTKVSFHKRIGNVITSIFRGLGKTFPLLMSKSSNVTVAFIFALLIGGTSTGMHLLFGKYLYIMLGVYIVFLLITSRIKKSMLRKIGFFKVEEVAMEKHAAETRQSALQDMKQVIPQQGAAVRQAGTSMSSDELAKQLEKIWNVDHLDDLQEQAEAKQEKEQEKPSEPNHKSQVEWPKEYNDWPKYVMIAVLVLGFAVRFGPYMLEKQQRPEPAAPEIQEAVQNAPQALQEEQEEQSAANQELIEQWQESILLDSAETDMDTFVTETYAPILHDHLDDRFILQLAEAEIEAVMQPHRGLPYSYVLLVNEKEEIHGVVELLTGKILNIYGEAWSTSGEDKEKYEEIMELFAEEEADSSE